MKHVFRTMVSAMILAAASVIPAMAGEMPAPYRELVKEVQDEFAGGCPRYQAWYSGNCEANENSLESVFADNEHFENRDPYGFGYVLKDLDGNGVDELLFVECDSGVIDDIWTLEQGSLKHVAHGYEFDWYYLVENGMIINSVSERVALGGHGGYTAYQLADSRLVKKAYSEDAGQDFYWMNPNFSQNLDYTTFDGKPYYLNLVTDYSKIHVDYYCDASVRPTTFYKELGDCYELPVNVLYYEFNVPVPVEEDELGYLYFAERTRLRITKDAQVTCRADDGSERITTMSAEEFFRTYAGNFLMCMDVEAYNEAGYATKLYSYTAG